jgi:hypothetical protein
MKNLIKQTKLSLGNSRSLTTVSADTTTPVFANEVSPSTLPITNPWFITGFADAEGSFSILIQHNTKFKTN